MEDCVLQLRFHKISVELSILRLQYSASNFGNPTLWTSLTFLERVCKTCLCPGVGLSRDIPCRRPQRDNDRLREELWRIKIFALHKGDFNL